MKFQKKDDSLSFPWAVLLWSLLIYGGLGLVPTHLQGIEVSFRFSAGLGRSNFNLINRSLDSYREKLKREASVQGWTMSRESPGHLETGSEVEAGLEVKLRQRLGFNLCTGFIHYEVNEDKTALIIARDGGNQVYARPTKVSAIPVSLSLVYFLPVKEKLQAYFRAGGGLCLVRYIDREANRKESDAKFVYPVYQNASASSPFLFGGAGFSFQIETTLALTAEINYRVFKAQGLEGENKAGKRGPLEFYEEFLPSVNYWQAKVIIVTSEPDPQFIRSRQRLVVDLTGFSFKIGMTARF